MAIVKNKSNISRSEQKVFNRTVDDKFDVVVVEMLGYDIANDSLKRIVVNSEGKIGVAV